MSRHRCLLFICIVLIGTAFSFNQPPEQAWIRINILGYKPTGSKVGVWCSKDEDQPTSFRLMDASTNKAVFTGKTGKAFGAYGPFKNTARLNFSAFKKPGTYYLQVGSTQSPHFRIDADVYKGTADFCLRYMRQQRSGFNPFLKDSCHTHDGYVLYGSKAGIRDSTHIDVVGGWHDATDYLQYATTSFLMCLRMKKRRMVWMAKTAWQMCWTKRGGACNGC